MCWYFSRFHDHLKLLVRLNRHFLELSRSQQTTTLIIFKQLLPPTKQLWNILRLLEQTNESRTHGPYYVSFTTFFISEKHKNKGYVTVIETYLNDYSYSTHIIDMLRLRPRNTLRLCNQLQGEAAMSCSGASQLLVRIIFTSSKISILVICNPYWNKGAMFNRYTYIFFESLSRQNLKGVCTF